MKRVIRVLIASAALAAAVSTSACEHMDEALAGMLVDSAFSAVGESLSDQNCNDLYPADASSNLRCDADDGW